MLLLVIILSVWLVRPFGVLADYVRYVRAQRSFSLPRLGRRALGAIGAAYDEMRDALAGRNYVADYVQTLTHEVKGPLSAIRGAAELLQEPMPEADRSRFVANIARETQRIQELVDRMIELTALESRKSLDRATPVPLRAAVDEVVASAAPAAPGARPAHRRWSSRRRRRDRQATPSCCSARVANLIDNALDFSPPGGAVSVEVVAHAPQLRRRRPRPRTRHSRVRRGQGVREVLFAGPARDGARRAPASACRSSRRSPTCTAAGSR